MNIFVDVDDTIVRSFGTKRIPIPSIIEAIRQLHEHDLIQPSEFIKLLKNG